MKHIAIAIILIFSKSILASCLPADQTGQYYNSRNNITLIHFAERTGGVTGNYFQSINSYYKSSVEVFMDKPLNQLCISLDDGKIYAIPMATVSISGGIKYGQNLNINDLFDFLNFKSNSYGGYSTINYYQDMHGEFLHIQFIGYISGFGPTVDINIKKMSINL